MIYVTLNVRCCQNNSIKSKWTTSTLLQPSTTTTPRIKTSTNHNAAFHLPPRLNATLLLPWRSWQPFPLACCPGLFPCLGLIALHHEALAAVRAARWPLHIVACVVLSAVLKMMRGGRRSRYEKQARKKERPNLCVTTWLICSWQSPLINFSLLACSYHY